MKKIIFLLCLAGALFAEQLYELNVSNMGCGGCAKRITNAAKSIEGVKNVTFDLKTKDVNITTTDDANITMIIDAIKKEKYKAELKK